MIFKWFKIFNLTDFQALNLVSKTYTLDLEGVGQKDILVTQGNMIGITYDGVFLALHMNESNPFVMDQRAIFIDEENDIYLGIQQP